MYHLKVLAEQLGILLRSSVDPPTGDGVDDSTTLLYRQREEGTNTSGYGAVRESWRHSGIRHTGRTYEAHLKFYVIPGAHNEVRFSRHYASLVILTIQFSETAKHWRLLQGVLTGREDHIRVTNVWYVNSIISLQVGTRKQLLFSTSWLPWH